MEYILLDNIDDLPTLTSHAPFKAVIAVEEAPDSAAQSRVARWLVEQGCLCAMICGTNSESWPAPIRTANLERVSLERMRPEDFVMVTAHPHERLRNVFWHAKKVARHSHVRMDKILILHMGQQNRSVEYLAMFNKA